MKQLLVLSALIVLLSACDYNEAEPRDSLYLMGITSGADPEFFHLKLASRQQITTAPVGCHRLGSAIYEQTQNAFGYTDCNGYFNLINPITGEHLAAYELPGAINQTVIDYTENALIGRYYDTTIMANVVIKLDLGSGELLASNALDFEGVYACTYFYNASDKTYGLLKSDGTLVLINPNDGQIMKSVGLEASIKGGYYDPSSNRLIGFTYSAETDENYVEVLDASTGSVMSRVQIRERNDYHACTSGYDVETNSYLMVTANDELIFVDVASGEITQRYEVDFDIDAFVFWRAQ